MKLSPQNDGRIVPLGFTLIELLVVVSIIGVLASLLLPVIAKSKSLARKTQCINNLRQIGLAIRTYALDHAERLPTFANGGQRFWRHSLQSYLALPQVPSKSDRVFICPADRQWFNYPYASHSFTSYEYNGFHVREDANPRLFWQLENVSAPSRTVLNAEAGARFYFSFHKPIRTFANNPLNHFLFADGHSAFLPVFVNLLAPAPQGYSVTDPWVPEPPPSYAYTWNVGF